MVSYWATATLTSLGLMILGTFIFLNAMFGSSDYTVSKIKYGKEVIAGEDDGLMYTDWIKLYDNNTFHILSYQVESNGYYSIVNDTIRLEHNDEYDEIILPDIFVIKNKGIYGYRYKDNCIDTSYYIYFGLYINKITTP